MCRIINERLSTQLTVESITRWNAWEIAGITKDEFFRTLDAAWYDWKAVPPTEENLAEKVSRLRQFGKVDIVTGRSAETVPHASSWLQHHRILYDKFVRTESTRSKNRLSYDLFIDDSAELMSLLASRLDGWGILYLRPWNRDAPDMPRIFKVERWDEIPAVLREIDSNKE